MASLGFEIFSLVMLDRVDSEILMLFLVILTFIGNDAGMLRLLIDILHEKLDIHVSKFLPRLGCLVVSVLDATVFSVRWGFVCASRPESAIAGARLWFRFVIQGYSYQLDPRIHLAPLMFCCNLKCHLDMPSWNHSNSQREYHSYSVAMSKVPESTGMEAPYICRRRTSNWK